ncbi:DUF2335 domain-containing protein [Robbsia andropogonis]|uniref:DUF2335 domain-containing protein n=1 Tax=Robbsia andropogonis TaxID=28092 RepID=UPI0021B22F55|nr:DUF2335 domain-containing protein [Robbsia andropogonis]
MTWSGPLPPPGAMQHFNQVIPNGADRIMKMVEQEQEQRLAQTKQILDYENADAKRGQFLGAALCALAIICAAYVARSNGPWEASVALVGVPILAVIRTIARRPNAETKNLPEKPPPARKKTQKSRSK